MTTTENRELLRDALPTLKALRYRTTISVPPDPSRSLGDGLSDEAVTLLEKLDGKGYSIVDPEGSSGQAATELFERGLLNLDVSGGGAYYVANELAERGWIGYTLAPARELKEHACCVDFGSFRLPRGCLVRCSASNPTGAKRWTAPSCTGNCWA